MMKKRMFLLVLILVVLLAACGSGAPASAPTSEMFFAADMGGGWGGSASPIDMPMPMATPQTEMLPEAELQIGSGSTSQMGHIIHEASATIRTEEFDETIRQIHGLIERHGGFIQHSNLSGAILDWQGRPQGRWADFMIRIPVGAYRPTIHALDDLGTVTHLSETATNVSAQYADLTSRLASYRVQEERILAMLERADTLTDMIELEARLGEIIFRIERITAQRNDLGQQVAYSTITLWISEVLEDDEEYIPITATAGAAFLGSLNAMQTFGRGLLIFFVTILPWAVVGAAILAPILLLMQRQQKQRQRKSD